MTWTTENLNEEITYWSISGRDNSGDPTFASPVSVMAKWEERTELFINVEGREERSRSVVYVDTDVVKGGYLFQGISSATDPLSVNNAFLIKDFRKIGNFENTVFERRVML